MVGGGVELEQDHKRLLGILRRYEVLRRHVSDPQARAVIENMIRETRTYLREIEKSTPESGQGKPPQSTAHSGIHHA
jgi:biotin-(acetyl-CoA carboxylase) ligase